MKSLVTRVVASCLVFSLLLTAAPLWGDDGSITPQLTKRLRNSVKMDAPTRTIRNALTANDAPSLVLDREIVKKHDALFSHKIKKLEVTNQNMSGRCWMFAASNILRPVAIEKKKVKNLEFSQSYLAFWDKLEKANCFLEDMIELRDRNPFDRELDFLLKEPANDGGYWDYYVALVEKYGLVPQEVMPETFSANNTKVMNAVLERLLRIDASKLRAMTAEKKSVDELRAAKKKMLAEVYRILVLNYGQPPAEFTFRFEDKKGKLSEAKTYTPQSFYKEWVGVDLSQYVNLCNDPTYPYEKHYRLRRIRNIVGTPELNYVNVPIETMRDLAKKSVLADDPVWFGADVSNDMDRGKGIMHVGLYDYGSLYGVNLKQSKVDRLLTRGGMANHAMNLVGVDIQGDKPVKWLVENSWGKERGDKGYWAMYDRWFDEHMYCIVVRKAYVPNNLLKVLKEEATELPPWAPMFAPFE